MSFYEEQYILSGSRNGKPLTLNALDIELLAFWEKLKTDDPLRNEILNDVVSPGALAIASEEISMMQDAGFDPVVTPVVVTFTSKLAYDLWKQWILPQIVSRWGANAITEKPGGDRSRSHSAR